MSESEQGELSKLSTRIQKLLTVGLLVVPCAAILSASTYFLILSSSIDVIPLSFFSLQDHFDKAVDLLIPVFVLVGTTSFATAFLAGIFDGPSEPRKKKRDHPAIALAKDWFLPVVFTGFGALMLLVHPEEERWQAALFGTFGILMLSVHLLHRSILKFISSRVVWLAIWGILITSILLFAYVFREATSSISSAKESGFAGQNTVLVDNFSFGHLIIEESKFKVKSLDGALLVESAPIPRESKSFACEWGWAYACKFTKKYGDIK